MKCLLLCGHLFIEQLYRCEAGGFIGQVVGLYLSGDLQSGGGGFLSTMRHKTGKS